MAQSKRGADLFFSLGFDSAHNRQEFANAQRALAECAGESPQPADAFYSNFFSDLFRPETFLDPRCGAAACGALLALFLGREHFDRAYLPGDSSRGTPSQEAFAAAMPAAKDGCSLFLSMPPSLRKEAFANFCDFFDENPRSCAKLQLFLLAAPAFLPEAMRQLNRRPSIAYAYESVPALDFFFACAEHCPSQLWRIQSLLPGHATYPQNGTYSLLLGGPASFQAYSERYLRALSMPNPSCDRSIAARKASLLRCAFLHSCCAGASGPESAAAFANLVALAGADPDARQILDGRRNSAGKWQAKPFLRDAFAHLENYTRYPVVDDALAFNELAAVAPACAPEGQEAALFAIGELLRFSRSLSKGSEQIAEMFEPGFNAILDFAFARCAVNDFFAFRPTTGKTIAEQCQSAIDKIPYRPLRERLGAILERERLLSMGPEGQADLEVKALDPHKLAEFTKLLELFNKDPNAELDIVIQTLRNKAKSAGLAGDPCPEPPPARRPGL